MPHLLFSAYLMNDTKWREVLLTVAQLRVPFEVAIKQEKFQIGMLFPPERLATHTIADPGLTGGGPLLYRDIYAIRVPRWIKTRDAKTGILFEDESPGTRFLAHIRALGQLPIEVLDEYIYVWGYGDERLRATLREDSRNSSSQ